MKMAKKVEVFWQEERKLFVASWEAQRKGLVDLERKCQDKSREIRMLNKRQENFQSAIEGKLRVRDRASERMQDQIIEETKELVHRKTEEALQTAVKEHDLWMCQNEKEEAKRLQGARKPRKDEEMAVEPPRYISKWPDGVEARKLEHGERRLEPIGEAEVPEIIFVSDAVEGTAVDLDGESRHEHVEAKLSRRGREMLNEDEEIGSPRRKVIRVESEETQDHVKDGKSTKKEEEERTFVPSAVSGTLKPLFRCDRQCSEKTLSYWQLASVVVNEGDEAYTTNLCQMCFNQHVTRAGKRG